MQEFSRHLDLPYTTRIISPIGIYTIAQGGLPSDFSYHWQYRSHEAHISFSHVDLEGRIVLWGSMKEGTSSSALVAKVVRRVCANEKRVELGKPLPTMPNPHLAYELTDQLEAGQEYSSFCLKYDLEPTKEERPKIEEKIDQLATFIENAYRRAPTPD